MASKKKPSSQTNRARAASRCRSGIRTRVLICPSPGRPRPFRHPQPETTGLIVPPGLRIRSADVGSLSALCFQARGSFPDACHSVNMESDWPFDLRPSPPLDSDRPTDWDELRPRMSPAT
ncbi:hypothetical protein AAFF_G00016810 [Aldrovandia affinis]|uniref:Uncharacterized protein n=1 Tax=Aldrovandia affinis TaxID=143900 RepID=A0AAD7WHB2_9TELE|nr:hypothetical protein AAFF_G00016810 [Aldrovandia affinis]